MRRITVAMVVALVLGGLVLTAGAQDTTTLLSNFLVGLRNGTIGNTTLNLTYLAADGTSTAPGVAYASEAGLGIYRNASGSIRAVQGGATIFTANSAGFDVGNGTLSVSGDAIFSRVSAGLLGYNGVPTVAFVTSDFSTTSVTLATITGLSWTLPANTARNIPFSCKLYYSQATAAVADAFGFQVATLAPTNAQVGGAVETALGTTAYGDATFTTTTAASVVSFTPGSIATIFNAYIDGFIEAPSGVAATVNIMALTGNASDSVTVKRGSFCRMY